MHHRVVQLVLPIDVVHAGGVSLGIDDFRDRMCVCVCVWRPRAQLVPWGMSTHVAATQKFRSFWHRENN